MWRLLQDVRTSIIETRAIHFLNVVDEWSGIPIHQEINVSAIRTKTGSAPDIQKLEEIRSNIGYETRLALASGVTEENISLFLPTVDTFLVASSIIERRKDLGNHEYLIPEKVMSLAIKIHA
jgi:predicted TIM-barrel enzyme